MVIRERDRVAEGDDQTHDQIGDGPGRALGCEEGWNPGVHDAEAFYAAYPSAFFVADREGEVVGTVSIVSYPGDECFAAFLMVRPHMRGHGIGGMLLDHLQAVGKGKNIGGDGVVAMLPTYAARGYKFAHWHLRFKGVGGGDEDRDLTDLVDVSFEELSRYDRSIFPAPRDEFLRSFLGQEGTRTLVSIDGGKITGYGTIRPSMTGHRIGPLFADDRPTAERIMRALVANIPGEPFFIDVPEPTPPPWPWCTTTRWSRCSERDAYTRSGRRTCRWARCSVSPRWSLAESSQRPRRMSVSSSRRPTKSSNGTPYWGAFSPWRLTATVLLCSSLSPMTRM